MITDNNHLFRLDLIDVTREVLHVIAANIYIPNIGKSYRLNDTNQLSTNGNLLDTLFSDLDNILSLDDHYSFDVWRRAAQLRGRNSSIMRQQFDLNARNQLTLWGPNGEILDYARKQWSGLVANYYRPRWSLFYQLLLQALNNKTQFNHTQFDKLVFDQIESPFGNKNLSFNNQFDSTTLSWIDQVESVYRRYYPICVGSNSSQSTRVVQYLHLLIFIVLLIL